MRGLINDLEVVGASRLSDALEILADPKHAGIKPIAGGTDLMVLLNAGVLQGKKFLDLSGLKSLGRIKVEPRRVVIGATATYNEIVAEPAIRRRFPILCESSRWTGALQIQSRGTLGGNIANASPAADSVPALMALGVRLRIASAKKRREVDLGEFYHGYKQMDLAPDELIVAIEIPNQPAGTKQYFRKVGTRNAQAISRVVVAGAIAKDASGKITHCRVAFGSVAPVTLRAGGVEDFILGKKPTPAVIRKAREILDKQIAPIDDIRSTGEYRRFVALNCLEQFLTEGEHTSLADWKRDV